MLLVVFSRKKIMDLFVCEVRRTCHDWTETFHILIQLIIFRQLLLPLILFSNITHHTIRR